jgi:hypothetical protein
MWKCRLGQCSLSIYSEHKAPASVQEVLFWCAEMLHSHYLHPFGHTVNLFRQRKWWKVHYHEPFGKDLKLASHFHPSIWKPGPTKRHCITTACGSCHQLWSAKESMTGIDSAQVIGIYLWFFKVKSNKRVRICICSRSCRMHKHFTNFLDNDYWPLLAIAKTTYLYILTIKTENKDTL